MIFSVIHLTSVHSRYDTRIFLKQCRSLAVAGYKVSLVVADGKDDEKREHVSIVDVGKSPGRFNRMLTASKRLFPAAKALDADLYHLHDPELLPVGLRLKKMGKKVIFDSHEDVPRQFLHKPYLNRPLRMLVSHALLHYERSACRRVDGIIAATPFIRDKFLAINPCTVDINNYPILGELQNDPSAWRNKKPQVCYVGGIGGIRGIREMVTAMEFVEEGARLVLGGSFSDRSLKQNVMHLKGWEHVDALGWLDREGIRNVLTQSMAGLVTLHPVMNYLDSLPVKMFEYMSAGLPVIASDFPLWREIVEGNNCGICVNPLAPQEIALAIDKLVHSPELAEEMGKNGRQAVEKKYNWQNEEQKLLVLYENVLAQ